MKKSLKSTAFFIGELLFMLAVPCLLIWLQYGKQNTVVWYKVSATGILLFLSIILIAKKILFKPFISKINAQVAQIEIQQLDTTDAAAIESTKRRFRRLSLWQLFFNSIMPALIMTLILTTIKVVEAGAIKMFNVLIICALSLFLGIVCRVGEIYSLRCEHESKGASE